MDDELLTTKEVADLLKLRIQTIYNWVHRGKLVAYKVGGVTRYKKSDVFKLLKKTK